MLETFRLLEEQEEAKEGGRVSWKALEEEPHVRGACVGRHPVEPSSQPRRLEGARSDAVCRRLPRRAQEAVSEAAGSGATATAAKLEALRARLALKRQGLGVDGLEEERAGMSPSSSSEG